MRSLPTKAVLISSALVSTAVILRLSLPLLLHLLTSHLPLLWSLALSWLQPPYLYLLINCIILSIVASSRLHVSIPPPPGKKDDAVVPPVDVVFGYDAEKSPLLAESVADGGDQEGLETERVLNVGESDVDANADAEFVISRSIWTPPKGEAVDYSPASSAEKPPVSVRFAHRKAVKASPEGKTLLRVSWPKRQETLESTWRTITEGRPIPLKRHLKKSDTFAGASHEPSPMKKSEAFDGGSSSPASSGRLRREASLSQDELNRRVEAFIKKFNEEMRLQRQESLNHYRRMVGRGTTTTGPH